MTQDLMLAVAPETLEGYQDALGPQGLGTFLLKEVMSPMQLEYVLEEVFDPSKVLLRDASGPFYNKRHGGYQNLSEYALRLTTGDTAPVARLPRLRKLAYQVSSVVRGLAPHFPTLADWEANEMSLHRYHDPEVGLTFHKDNLRYFGMIGILTLEGKREFVSLDEAGQRHTFVPEPGDLLLNRAAGLYVPQPALDSFGKRVNICPDHGVYRLQTPYSTSFMTRLNTKPHEAVEGFTFDNWPEAA